MGEESGGKWMHMCVRLSPSAARLNLAQHCSSVILQYKIDSCFFFKKKKKSKSVILGIQFFTFLAKVLKGLLQKGGFINIREHVGW